MNQRGFSPAVMIAALAAAVSISLSATERQRNVLCTTFPVFQCTRNVVAGRDEVKVGLLLPANLGCPHDYALTPQDLRQLEQAEVLVINGLGMEDFLGTAFWRQHPRLTVIDASAGITELIRMDGDTHHDEPEHEDGEAAAGTCPCHSEHQHGSINPHLFASPRQMARMALAIATGLAKADPDGASIYTGNAQDYVRRLNTLADEFRELAKRLANRRIVQPHGVMDYLARDMGLTIVAVIRGHNQEPSAAEMLELLKTIRRQQVGAIFVEPQYSAKVGQVLAREAGLPVVVFDPVAGGPEDAAPDYYEQTMRANLAAIRKALGRSGNADSENR